MAEEAPAWVGQEDKIGTAKKKGQERRSGTRLISYLPDLQAGYLLQVNREIARSSVFFTFSSSYYLYLFRRCTDFGSVASPKNEQINKEVAL